MAAITSRRGIAAIILAILAGSLAAGVLILAGRAGTREPRVASGTAPGFISQADARYGYEMLVPRAWQVVDTGDGRAYTHPDPAQAPDRVALTAANLRTLAAAGGDDTRVAQYELWKRSPSLPEWAQALEANWRRMGITAREERSLPNARIYSVTPSQGEVRLIAYAVDGDQPLVVQLQGGGRYGSLEGLRREGLLRDFETVVSSVRAR